MELGGCNATMFWDGCWDGLWASGSALGGGVLCALSGVVLGLSSAVAALPGSGEDLSGTNTSLANNVNFWHLPLMPHYKKADGDLPEQLFRQRALRESSQFGAEGRPSVSTIAREGEVDPLLELLRLNHPELDPSKK